MRDHITLEAARRAHALLDNARAATEIERWSISDAVLSLSKGRLSGAALECKQEAERNGWGSTMSNSMFIPYAMLGRALTVASAPNGGRLVPTTLLPAADAIRSNLAFGALGLNVIDAPANANVILPTVKASGTAYMLPTETTQITGSQQQTGQVAFFPKCIGGYTELSRQLLLQSTAQDMVKRDLSAIVWQKLEQQIGFGSTINGELWGLKGYTGVQTLDASGFDLDNATDAAGKAGDAFDESFGFATTRTAALALRKRQEFTGSSYTVWRGKPTFGTVCDLDAASSSGIVADHVFAGPWKHYNLVAYGGGLEVAVNIYGDPTNTNFVKGIVGVRVIGTFDGAPTWPAAFSVGTNFS
jgi:HK97 family phage major capsid protein